MDVHDVFKDLEDEAMKASQMAANRPCPFCKDHDYHCRECGTCASLDRLIGGAGSVDTSLRGLAALAMQGLLASGALLEMTPAEVAEQALQCARALLESLSNKEGL